MSDAAMLDAPHVDGYSLACPRVPIENPAPDVYKAGGAMLPASFIEKLEQNQQLPSCCRHPERHDIEAFYSSAEDEELGIPDIYVLHCTCGARHMRQCFQPPRTVAILVYCLNPGFNSHMVECMRPTWTTPAL